MKLNELDSAGYFIVDHVEGNLPPYWTADLVGNGYYKARYVGATLNKATGEFSGGRWIETGGLTEEELAAIQEANRLAAVTEQGVRMAHASNVINTLVDEQDFEGVDRTELIKLWRLYRLEVKNTDVTTWPVTWPVAPSLTKE